MSDPCDSPGACRGIFTRQSNSTTRFDYTCPDLPPPEKFGLETYAIEITEENKNNLGNVEYAVKLNNGTVANGGTGSVTFSMSGFTFVSTFSENPNAWESIIDFDDNALIISTRNGFTPAGVKAGVTWRIGSEFASCLLLLTAFCDSPLVIPLVSSGTFLFPCPNLPLPVSFGLGSYNLRIQFVEGIYTIYAELEPGGEVVAGTFIYNFGFTVESSENGFLLTVRSGNLRLTRATPQGNLIWDLTLENGILSAVLNVPVQPDQIAGAPTQTTEPVPGCPLLSGNVVGKFLIS